ncbi:hypothetical protein AAFF_G00260140 [Aldrovandia affinis]|uniref:CaM kinase-like vesicle-associated protein n=1 Tax=Aldrovandia affinis TaxID=143900 RepID=A0AAD7RCB9_9TELE|nr:hypothetical protein AAFF_G00260140 [Aldrovandia affinis]
MLLRNPCDIPAARTKQQCREHSAIYTSAQPTRDMASLHLCTPAGVNALNKVSSAMPFGCLVPRDGGRSSSLSDITDKYEFGEILRAKEFCELCLAKERRTGEVFICKKFLKKDGRKVRRAAKNEILILRMVSHPNILQLVDTYETRKGYFIIQEIATGGDLFDWILNQGSYTERDAAYVIRQVLEAVAYLHSLNIIHRNLKLENLMYYTENNQSKVVLQDFYLSRFENSSITEPCGTPEYLAPEVVSRRRYGRPVDCWAMGVIMYILLSGNPPFYDEAEEDNTDLHNRIIFCRIAAGEFEFDSPFWDDISPAAKALVCRLMEVDQMLRITAKEALGHEWITGQVASERNLKDVVCAQFKRNFAKAKWRKALCVTTFMQRLHMPETKFPGGEGGEQGREGDEGEAAPGSTADFTQKGSSGAVEQEKEQEEQKKQECSNTAEKQPADSSTDSAYRSSHSFAPCSGLATGSTAPFENQHKAVQQQEREVEGRGLETEALWEGAEQ